MKKQCILSRIKNHKVMKNIFEGVPLKGYVAS